MSMRWLALAMVVTALLGACAQAEPTPSATGGPRLPATPTPTPGPASPPPSADAPTPTPEAAPTTLPGTSTTPSTSPPVSEAADVIFFNGHVITMEPDMPSAEAVAVLGENILHVGTAEQTLALAGPETQVIDLGGRALLPGFVDPHTHPLGSLDSADSFEEAQRYILEGGTTSIGDAAVGPGKLERLLQLLESTELRIRTSLYLAYNSKCDGIAREGWFLDYPPVLDPNQMLRFPGFKIFGDPAGLRRRCGWAPMSVLLPPEFAAERGAGPYGDLLLSVEEMAQVIARYQALGYQVVIHARGDITVETALDAIESALDGQPNTFRHRIDHNDYIRPELLSRYGEVGVVPVIRGRPDACLINDLGGVDFFGEEVQPWRRVARSLIDANPDLPVAWHSDVGAGGRRPIHDLYDLVTRKQIRQDDGAVCVPPDWLAAEAVSVEEALRLMTINGAYALFMEEKVGSVEAGKFADLLILSGNPLTLDPDSLIDLEVLMTMVGGRVEHCASGSEALCP